MKTKRQKLNWIIDAISFAVFIICFLADLTGLVAHQILGIAIGALCGYHMILHWSWIKTVTTRLFKHTSRQAKNFYVVDAGITLGLLTMLITGLFISTWFELTTEHYLVFKNIHVIAAVVTLLLIVMKIGLHRHWIIGTAKHHIFTRSATREQTPCPQPVTASYDADRRNFLKLMGIVGLLSAVAIGGSLGGIKNALINESSAVESGAKAPAQNSSQGSTSESTASGSGNTGTCTVRCHERCSYPGRCHRYTDTNGNGRCDLGECM
jgi:hypothetical protein